MADEKDDQATTKGPTTNNELAQAGKTEGTKTENKSVDGGDASPASTNQPVSTRDEDVREITEGQAPGNKEVRRPRNYGSGAYHGQVLPSDTSEQDAVTEKIANRAREAYGEHETCQACGVLGVPVGSGVCNSCGARQRVDA